MFDSNIIVGLEIGTSKICAVVGEQNAEGALNIIGLGQARSRGVRKGEIVDAALAEEDVRNAIVEAEKMANVEIRSVYLGVTGGHIRGFNNHGIHPVVSADREISEEDVEDVVKNAKAVNLPAENAILHAVRQHFFVDGQDGIIESRRHDGRAVGGGCSRGSRRPDPAAKRHPRRQGAAARGGRPAGVQRPRVVARAADGRAKGTRRAGD